MKLTRDRINRKVYLSQSDYAAELVAEICGPNGFISSYPLQSITLKLDKSGVNKPIYDIIGKIRYLADRTRPDLLYSLSYLSKFQVFPSNETMKEITRLVQYIKGTLDYKLTLGSTENIELFGMSDASFVQKDDCKSQIGYCIYFSHDSGAICNKSKQCTTVSLSSTQSEVEALVELVKEVIWFQGFMKEMNINFRTPTNLLVDNKPTVILAKDGNYLKKIKTFCRKISIY